MSLLSVDDSAKVVVLADTDPIVYLATESFVGYLLYDLLHVVAHWPALGGSDTVAHHVGFTCLALLGYGFRVFPFTVGWLLLGEISTLFLNARWALINSGRGHTRALAGTNVAFAASFFSCRVVLLWVGPYHMLTQLRPLVLAPPFSAPAWAVNTICGFVTAGAALNAWWMLKIAKMAARGHGKEEGESAAPPTPSSTSESPLVHKMSPKLAPAEADLLGTPCRRVNSADTLSESEMSLPSSIV